jgi:hypothetical protein
MNMNFEYYGYLFVVAALLPLVRAWCTYGKQFKFNYYWRRYALGADIIKELRFGIPIEVIYIYAVGITSNQLVGLYYSVMWEFIALLSLYLISGVFSHKVDRLSLRI